MYCLLGLWNALVREAVVRRDPQILLLRLRKKTRDVWCSMCTACIPQELSEGARVERRFTVATSLRSDARCKLLKVCTCSPRSSDCRPRLLVWPVALCREGKECWDRAGSRRDRRPRPDRFLLAVVGSLRSIICRCAHVSQLHVLHLHSKVWHGTTRACDDGRLTLPFMCRNVCDRSFFSKAPTEKASPATVSPGDQFLYQEDWGEKYTGVRFQHPTNIALKTVRNYEFTRKGRTAAASLFWDRLIIIDMCGSVL